MIATFPVHTFRSVLEAAARYVGFVFGIGFVLGAIRVVWLVPRLGVRTAELLEQPLMLVTVFLVARWVVRRLGTRVTRIETLAIGFLALTFLLVAELVVALLLQTNRTRDPISSAAYILMLVVFALMPWLLSRSKAS